MDKKEPVKTIKKEQPPKEIKPKAIVKEKVKRKFSPKNIGINRKTPKIKIFEMRNIFSSFQSLVMINFKKKNPRTGKVYILADIESDKNK